MLPILIILGITLILLAWPWLRRNRRSNRRAAMRRQSFPLDWSRLLKQQVPLYARLPETLREQLHGHILVLLVEKDFHAANGFVITDSMRLIITAQAALLLLNRPVEYFPQLRSIVLHPARFVVNRETWDATGVHHSDRQVLSGESWDQGQLVLSWDDSLAGGMNSEDGYNVVLHEFAHQLDLESGAVNGMPRLDSSARCQAWTRIFSAAYADHCARIEASNAAPADTWLDPYAATSPAEFFAVITEAFYELPQAVQAQYPQVYAQLRDYYCIDPLAWLSDENLSQN